MSNSVITLRAPRGRAAGLSWKASIGLGLVVAFLALLIVAPARASAAQTVVSLTFDDGSASEYWALNQLNSHGMLGTFYINSSQVGTSDYYMTWSQIHDIYNAGNEIGGHTSNHFNLPQTDPAEAQRQICNDRVNLLNQGFSPTDFAYPFGAFNTTIQQYARQCGYDSARSTNTVTAETLPPADPYAIRVGPGTDLGTLKTAVMNAENGSGGWVPLVFHQICNACDTNWITQPDFSSFLDWLQSQESSGAVTVDRVQDVIGGALKPGVQGPAPPPAPNGFNVVRNASLEANSSGGTSGSAPDCFSFDGFGNNNAKWSSTNDAHTGLWAERVDMSNFTDGDAKLIIARDQGACTPSVTPGHSYVLTEWYKSSVPVYFSVFTRDALGASSYWDSTPASPTFPASSGWTKATWTTPVIPSGVTGLSFGLTISANGFMVVDDYGVQDAHPTGSPDTSAPTVSINSPANNQTVAGTVPISVTASDNIAVDRLDYLIDGSVVGSETDGLNTYNWFTGNLASGAHTIAVRAVDPSGNATTTSTRTVIVSNSHTNMLQNPSLEAGSGSTPACWQASGYGTNTVAWTRTSDAHTGSWAENLNVSSWTNGDRKLLNTFDTGACAPAAIPGHTYTVSAWYKVPSGTATPKLYVYYLPSGTWTYLKESNAFPSSSTWTQVSWATPALPAGATNISVGMGLPNAGSVTMDDLTLTDNSPPPDTTPPTSSIFCNGASDAGGCASGWYSGSVQVSLSATDDLVGSGVAAIRYTTDGSDPSPTNGSAYSGPFSVSSTTTVKYRAYDNAGNAEAVHTQVIHVDNTPPASTISCGGSSCQSGWYNASTSVSLAATDAGGAGVAFIRYTTDGSDPSLSNGSDYVGPFSVSSTAAVKFRAYDNAGNAETVNTQMIQIDSTAPDTLLDCNGSPCQSGWHNAAPLVSLSATDDGGGSGVAAIYYTTDGSTPTQSIADLYTGPFTASATQTVNYFAVDNAGNVESMNTSLVQVDTATPASAITCNSQACPAGWNNSSVAVRLSATDNAGGSGVASIRYTTDGSDPSMTNGVTYNGGAFSLSTSTTVKYRAFDNAGNAEPVNTQLIQIDSLPPSSTISCNGGACSAAPYAGAVEVALAATDNGGGAGIAGIYYTADGTAPTATVADLYTGPFLVSSTATVKYFTVDNAGNAEPVNSQAINVAQAGVTLTSPSSGDTVSGTTTLSATVSGITVDHVTFFVDGAAVGTVSSTPYTVAWDSTTIPDGSHTVVAAAFDVSGAESDSAAVTFSVSNNAGDATAPVSTISCNGGACAAPWYTSAVSVTLSAVDNPGGSGVASIRYTTDGSDPSLTNGLAYSGSFSVGATTTVKYRAYDNAGNAEPVNRQVIQLDTVAPQSSISCNSGPCAGSFYTNAVLVTLTATDNNGGSGVASVVYTTDGSIPTASNGTTYTGPFAINTTTRVRYRAFDVAGNAEPTNGAVIQVDMTPPTSSASCNGNACSSGWYSNSVSMTLSASDNTGGSGVASIRYTTNGSDPSLTNGQVYGGAFSIAATTTVKYRAFDSAGNAEAIHSQLVQIDTVAPHSTISCNGASCASSFYTSAVSVSLSATDSGGSGVASIAYTTDGSTPTTNNGTTYAGSFTVSSPTTVKYRAFDAAGNAEAVNSALIQVDTTPPTSTVSCNGGSCAGWLKPSASVTLSATDGPSGSGVASIRYTTDGSTPTGTTGTRYTAPFTINATTTVKYRAFDNVGNTEAVNTQVVQIDGTAPTVSLTSPTAGLASGTVTLSANPSDNVGVDHVDFLVDGTVVGTDQSAPYTYAWNSNLVPDGTHSITARAVDLAGNTTTSSATSITTTNNNLLPNPSLETGTTTTPTCWLLGGYGTNTFTWTRTNTDAHTGSFSENLDISSWTNGDRKMIVAEDTGTCAPVANPGHTYTVTAWYKQPAGSSSKPNFYAYYRNSAGTWTFWTQISFPISTSWTQGTWTTPAVPAGATNISIGVGLENTGSVAIDDLALYTTG